MLADLAQQLLLPIQEDSPCGSDLEYDAQYLELQMAAAVKGEQQFGTTIIPAQHPNWGDVAQRAIELLRRTRDLRVLAYLARAQVELEGISGYAQVLAVAQQWLETYWDDLHPRILVDDEEDPMPRINAIASLMEMESIGRALRNAPLVRGDFGTLSLRELEALLESDANGASRLAQMLAGKNHPELNHLQAIGASLLGVSKLIERQLGSSWIPDFSAFAKPFGQIARALHSSQQEAEPTAPAGPATSAQPTASVSPVVAAPRDFNARPERREQAMQMMDSICLYFERHEPGHPAALLIRRAQRLMPMSFMEIIQDMAPDSGQTFQHIFGADPAKSGD
jgi:type VI secretion system protein ImpA